MGTIDNLHFSVKFDIFPINDRVLRKQSQKRDEINMPERVNKRPTTAKEALKLVKMGEAGCCSIEHTDPFTDATVDYATIYGRRKFIFFGRRTIKKYVILSEYRPYTGTAVVSGTLRGGLTDKPVYEEDVGLAWPRPRT